MKTNIYLNVNLRRIGYLFAFSLFFIIPHEGYSHGSCKNRNNCSGTINTPYKYRASARVVSFGLPKWQISKDCPQSAGGIGNGVAFASVSNSCANQSARNQSGKWELKGRVTKHKRFCSRGQIYPDLYYDLGQYMEEDESDYEDSDIYTSNTIFSQHSVRIDSISGFMRQKGNNMHTSFEVIMWLPEDDHDTTITPQKTFFNGKVELSNGELIAYGDFESIDFTLSVNGEGESIVVFDNFSIEAFLPDGIDGTSDLIEVVGISDGHEDEEADIDDFLNSESEIFEVTINPNPTNNLITIEVGSLDNTTRIFDIHLYDKHMNKIPQNFQLNEAHGSTIDIQLSNYTIPHGFVFILIVSEDCQVLKKIIYQ